MITKRELYERCLEFLNWINEYIKHPDINEFTNGMKLLNEKISADVEIWMDWEESVPDEILPEEAFTIFEMFLRHWIEKDDLYVFEQVIYMFDPEDIEYEEAVSKNWEMIVLKKK